MDLDELFPDKPADPLAGLIKQDLDPLSVEELEARVREATKYVPIERLAVSPQCGFSTSVVGNEISPEDEVHKLRTLVETAERIWG